MKRLLIIALSLCCLTFCAGCATIAGTDSRYVPVDSPLAIASQDSEKNETLTIASNDGTTELSWKTARTIEVASATAENDLVFLGELENTGSEPVAIYSLKLLPLDNDGKEFTKSRYASTYPSVLEPGDSAFICSPVYNSINDTDMSLSDIASVDTGGEYAKLRLIDASYEVPLLEISSVAYKEILDYPGFSCVVTNHSNSTVTNATVICPVYAKDGTLLSVIVHAIKSIAPGESIEVSQRAWACDESASYTDARIEPFIHFEEKVGR